jgi:hypothetical protein
MTKNSPHYSVKQPFLLQDDYRNAHFIKVIEAECRSAINSYCSQVKSSRVGYEVPTEARINLAVFWVVAPCSLIEAYRCFKGTCCPHHQGDNRL